jgi:hypothetical protein
MSKRILGVALAGALALSVTGARIAVAKGGDVIQRGSCSGSSDWKLKLSPEDGKTEVQFEVDSNVVGQTWKVKIFKNGDRIFSGKRVTKAPSGCFEVRLVTSNPAGSDTYRGRAVNPSTDETCVGKSSI